MKISREEYIGRQRWQYLKATITIIMENIREIQTFTIHCYDYVITTCLFKLMVVAITYVNESVSDSFRLGMMEEGTKISNHKNIHPDTFNILV